MLVRIAAFLTEAVIMVGRGADEIMGEAWPLALEEIGLRLPVPQRELEGRGFFTAKEPGERERRTADLRLHESGFNRDAGLCLFDRQDLRAGKSPHIETVAPPNRIAAREFRGKRPRARHSQALRPHDQQTNKMPVQKEQRQAKPAIEADFSPASICRDQPRAAQRQHSLCLP